MAGVDFVLGFFSVSQPSIGLTCRPSATTPCSTLFPSPFSQVNRATDHAISPARPGKSAWRGHARYASPPGAILILLS